MRIGIGSRPGGPPGPPPALDRVVECARARTAGERWLEAAPAAAGLEEPHPAAMAASAAAISTTGAAPAVRRRQRAVGLPAAGPRSARLSIQLCQAAGRMAHRPSVTERWDAPEHVYEIQSRLVLACPRSLRGREDRAQSSNSTGKVCAVFGSLPIRRGAPVALVLVAIASGCGRSGAPGSPGSRGGARELVVVAAENFWGSIAAQLGGERASVSSIIVNPDTDPHSYEPNARDARMLASAQLVIANGTGYDAWANRLLAASPLPGRRVLNVGGELGLGQGDNPHQWYSPAHVHLIVDRITAAYERLDPAEAAYFARRRVNFLTVGLARYEELRREIRAEFAGVPVGYSESIFQPLGEDLGLRLVTPSSFAKAIAEGTDVTAQDKQLVDAQASQREIKVWVFNSQNVTPDVQRVNAIVRERGIPIATVTETLAPALASFEQWQVAQLEALRAALRRATAR
jgi:zinc/manganese transport system substrate-binding protein